MLAHCSLDKETLTSRDSCRRTSKPHRTFLDYFDEVELQTVGQKSEEDTHNFRKNLIKINKKRLPPDFFGRSKPGYVTASVSHRSSKASSKCASPRIKHSSKNLETNTASPDTDNEEESQLMKLTSCFGGSIPIDLSTHRRNLSSKENYYSAKQIDSPTRGSFQIGGSETSIQHGESTTSRRVSLQGSQQSEAGKECQLPPIKVSPLRRKIQKSRKLSDGNGDNNGFKSRISALMTNSSLPPQIGALCRGEVEHPKAETDRVMIKEIRPVEQENLNITFFRKSKRSPRLFQE